MDFCNEPLLREPLESRKLPGFPEPYRVLDFLTCCELLVELEFLGLSEVLLLFIVISFLRNFSSLYTTHHGLYTQPS